MFRIVPLSLVLAASVQAQEARPRLGEHVVLTVAGIGAAVGASYGTYTLLYPASDAPAGVASVVLAYPLGMAAGTALSARALGLDAPVGTVLVDALLGVPAGAAAGVLTAVVVGGGIYVFTVDVDYNLWPLLVGGGLGIITAVGVSSAVATRRVRIAPAVLAAPMGERAPGLSLRLAL